MTTRRPPHTTIHWLALFALGVALLIWRRPDAVVTPQLWAEDGVVFFLDAWRCGPAAVWYHYSGYLHLFPRLVALVAAWLPVEATPHVYAWSTVIPTVLVAQRIASPHFTAAPYARVAMMVPLALPPMAADMTFAPSYSHWVLALLFPLALASSVPRTSRDAIGDALRLALAAGSSPLGIVFAPFLLARALVHRTNGAVWLASLPACALAALQLWMVTSSGRLDVARPGVLIDLAAHAMVTSVLGETTGLAVLPWLPSALWILLLTGLVGAVLLVGIVRRNHAAAVLAAASLLVTMTTLVSVRAHPDMILAARYHFLPITLAVWSIVLLQHRWQGAALAVLVVPLLSMPLWKVPPRADLDWATASACLSSGGPCVIPIHPEGWKIDVEERFGRRQAICGHRD